MDELDEVGPIELVAPRETQVELLLVMLLLTAGGLMVAAREQPFVGWMCFAVFALMSVAFAATTWRPPRLAVDANGFVLEMPWRRYRYEFVDCGEYTPVPAHRPLGRGHVQFLWKPAGSEVARKRHVQAMFGGSETDLAALLNRRRSAIVDR